MNYNEVTFTHAVSEMRLIQLFTLFMFLHNSCSCTDLSWTECLRVKQLTEDRIRAECYVHMNSEAFSSCRTDWNTFKRWCKS